MLATSIDVWDPFVCFDRQRILRHQRLDSRVEKTDDGITLSVEIPGVKFEDINVQTFDRKIKLAGKKKGNQFDYSYTLSDLYDISSCSATLQNGILSLHFLKNAAYLPKTIQIKID
jgi:HSP20 family molecular chaperone IbpA